MKYYIAGGAVRDLLLGLSPHDIDLSFQGEESKFLKENPDARKIESKQKIIYQKKQQEFTEILSSPKEDVLDRDFTINSFLLDASGKIYMHPLSISDLKKKIIRPTSKKSLKNDPLRFFRAARFKAVFPDFKLSSSCLKQMRELKDNDFKKIPAERVGQELIKACAGQKSGNFLRAIEESGAWPFWLKEFSTAASIIAGPEPYHYSSVLEHTAKVMDKSAELARELGYTKDFDPVRIMAVWMAFVHDLGKINTEAKVLPQHYAHEKRGREIAAELTLRLRLSKRYKEAAVLASALHMKAARYESLRLGTKVDLLSAAALKGFFIPLFIMVMADSGHLHLLQKAKADLEIIKKVKLPDEWQNRSQESGLRLREMRCQALANANDS